LKIKSKLNPGFRVEIKMRVPNTIQVSNSGYFSVKEIVSYFEIKKVLKFLAIK